MISSCLSCDLGKTLLPPGPSHVGVFLPRFPLPWGILLMLLTDVPGGPVTSQTLFQHQGNYQQFWSLRHRAYNPTRSAEIKLIILKEMSVLEREVWIPSSEGPGTCHCPKSRYFKGNIVTQS